MKKVTRKDEQQAKKVVGGTKVAGALSQLTLGTNEWAATASFHPSCETGISLSCHTNGGTHSALLCRSTGFLEGIEARDRRG